MGLTRAQPIRLLSSVLRLRAYLTFSIAVVMFGTFSWLYNLQAGAFLGAMGGLGGIVVLLLAVRVHRRERQAAEERLLATLSPPAPCEVHVAIVRPRPFLVLGGGATGLFLAGFSFVVFPLYVILWPPPSVPPRPDLLGPWSIYTASYTVALTLVVLLARSRARARGVRVQFSLEGLVVQRPLGKVALAWVDVRRIVIAEATTPRFLWAKEGSVFSLGCQDQTNRLHYFLSTMEVDLQDLGRVASALRSFAASLRIPLEEGLASATWRITPKPLKLG